MKVWLITDTHFGHKQMIEYCGRPEGFEELILKNLKNVLKPEDVLIHLGDFCLGNDKEWHRRFMELPSKKWLLKGNHDNKSNAWYLEHGWDFAGDLIKDKYFGKKIVLSHVPTRDDNTFDLNIHGHFHNNLHRLIEGKYIDDAEKNRNKEDLAVLTDKHKLMAVEHTNYQPVTLENFIK